MTECLPQGARYALCLQIGRLVRARRWDTGRLARLAYADNDSLPESPSNSGLGNVNASESKLHVFFKLGDHLGSTSVVLDKATGELVERSSFQVYGGAESDYRPDRWKNFREDYKFTGKEEDVEVGLQYFGKRYLNPLLGRWILADPLAIQVPGRADLNAYAYVRGTVLKNLDPLGLCDNQQCSSELNASYSGGGAISSTGIIDLPEMIIVGDASAGRAIVEPPPISPTIWRVDAPVPFLGEAKDELFNQAESSNNGLEKGTGYALGAFLYVVIGPLEAIRAVLNIGSNGELIGQHGARAKAIFGCRGRALYR